MPKFLGGFSLLFLLNFLYYQNTVVKLAVVDKPFSTAHGRVVSTSMHPNSSLRDDEKASIDSELLELNFSSLQKQQANKSGLHDPPLQPAIAGTSTGPSSLETDNSTRIAPTSSTHPNSSEASNDFPKIRWEYTLADGARLILEQVPPELAVPAGRRYTALARSRWLNRTGSAPARESSAAPGRRAPPDGSGAADLARIRRIWIWGARLHAVHTRAARCPHARGARAPP